MTIQTQHGHDTSERAIPVRTPHFDFESDIPMLWFGGNSFLTFFSNGLNLTFPEGERHFVRAVFDHKDRISDPELLEQIKGFAGQEGWHAHEHERFFDALRAQGFDLDPFFEQYQRYARWVSKRPAALRLATTAALEHYTATLALLTFEHDLLRDAHPELRKLLMWHATEELEHRAVAFDVLQATHPGYPLRAYGFVVGSLSLARWLVKGMRVFVEQSGVSRETLKRDRRRLNERMGGELTWQLVKALAKYLRPGFHPHEIGSVEQARRWLRDEGLTVATDQAAHA